MAGASVQLLQKIGGGNQQGIKPIGGASASAQLFEKTKDPEYKAPVYQTNSYASATPAIPEKPKEGIFKKVVEGTKKFAARTAVGAADMLTEAVDYSGSFGTNNLDVLLRAKDWMSGNYVQALNPARPKMLANKWKDFYNDQLKKGNVPARELKKKVDEIQNIEYLQPSKEWQQSTLQQKLTTKLPETIFNIGPSILSSIGVYAINPLAGASIVATSTANEIKNEAMKVGVNEQKAELLGLATGVFVSALDRIVPEETFGNKAVKDQFLKGFLKRVTSAGIKEATTEVAQENIQLAAEATFRQDLGWDEVKSRNAMAALGGVLGGVGMGSVSNFVNNVQKVDIMTDQNILGQLQEKPGTATLTPQQAFQSIVGTEFENSTEGKEIAKQAVKAQSQGKNLQVATKKGGGVEVTLIDAQNADSEMQTINDIQQANQRATGKGILADMDNALNAKDYDAYRGYLEQMKSLPEGDPLREYIVPSENLLRMVGQEVSSVPNPEGSSDPALTDNKPGFENDDIPKTVRVWIKSKFSEDGAYADIPVIRKEDNLTLYQGGKSKKNKQFWTPDKKYAAQFGEVREKTGTFYRVDNGNRVTRVYVEAKPQSTKNNIQELDLNQTQATTTVKTENVPESTQQTVQDTSGKKRNSRVAERLLETLKENDPNFDENSIQYRQMNIAEDAARATDFAKKNPKEALLIAKNRMAAPTDITGTAINIAVSEEALAKGDYQTYADLINSYTFRQTRLGQEIVAEKGRESNRTDSFMKQVIKARLEQVAKQRKWVIEKGKSMANTLQKGIDNEVASLKKEIDSKVLAKLNSAQSLIDSLTCK